MALSGLRISFSDMQVTKESTLLLFLPLMFIVIKNNIDIFTKKKYNKKCTRRFLCEYKKIQTLRNSNNSEMFICKALLLQLLQKYIIKII